MWVTGAVSAGTVRLMDDQNEAWRRLTDARLKTLEAAVQTRRIRRRADGRPLPALPYQPGDRKPLTKWLELRVLAIELIIQLILAADKYRADELDVHSLEAEVDTDLWRMDAWAAEQVEPDAGRQETIAMIMEARVILMEAHTWPLAELEELRE